MALTAIVTIIAAYLIGSINFAVIFTKIFVKSDVRELGSGNAGTTNVMRVGGVLPGILTFVFDALKGAVAAILGRLIFDYIFSQTQADWAAPIYGAFACGVACMIGHIFPIFFDFKGGKGVAVSVGIFYVCNPLAITIGLCVFALVLIISKIVSLSSLTATIVVVALSFVFYDKDALFLPQAVSAFLMGGIVYLKHIENIKRLIAGKESRLSFGGRK